MKITKIIIASLAILFFASCANQNSGKEEVKEEYVITKSIDFEHHFCDQGLMDYMRTRTEYPYIKDGWLYYNEAFPIPIDSPMVYYHPAADASTPAYFYLTDLEKIRLADLDYAEITTAALSADPVIYLLDKASLVKYAQITNDAAAAAVKLHPDRYIGSICLPLPYVEESLAELERAVNVLGLKYFNTWSNYKDKHIYDAEFEPVLAKCAELNVPIYLHPGIPGDKYLTDSGPSMASAGFGFSVDVMKSMMRLIIGGVFDRYPNLTIIMGHMAEFFPYCLERMDNRFSTGAGAGVDPFVKCQKSFTEYFKSKNILMSTSGISEPEVVYFVINTIGPDNIIFGTDYPYEDYKVAADFVKNLNVSNEIKDKIFYKNAEEYILK